jgi:hypothetical protein
MTGDLDIILWTLAIELTVAECLKLLVDMIAI